MNITPRSDWDARAPRFVRALSTTHNGWFWHWLGNSYPAAMSDEQILQSIQRYHMDTKGWSDVAYSFAVGRGAQAYELRGWDVAGGHTNGFNNTSMAIVFLIGEGEYPTPDMFRTAWSIMAMRPEITLLRSHRDVGLTSCPGNEIAAEVIHQRHKETVMPTVTASEAEAAIRRSYVQLLGRPADLGGLTYWRDRVLNETLSLEEVRWEFLAVRLAAETAAREALASTINSVGGPAPEVVAEQAYRLFLDNLVALQS